MASLGHLLNALRAYRVYTHFELSIHHSKKQLCINILWINKFKSYSARRCLSNGHESSTEAYAATAKTKSIDERNNKSGETIAAPKANSPNESVSSLGGLAQDEQGPISDGVCLNSVCTKTEKMDKTLVKTRKRTKPLSDLMKVIRDKKMLEKYKLRSERKKYRSPSSAIPTITTEGGFKDQLSEYISRHDETWEEYDDHKQFGVSKSGKVLIFPLNNSGTSFDKHSLSCSDDIKLPSVTTILRVTKPMQQALALMKWEKKMIAELGEDGFKEMKKQMFAEGHEIHNNIEKYFTGTPVSELQMSPETLGYWESCSEVFPRFECAFGFELKVKHPALSYTGYVDCVAELDGKISLIEWKTSRKPKLDLSRSEDYPLQVIAYLGAMNFDPKHTVQVEQVVIVVAYKDGQKATVHILDEDTCNIYWTKWLSRLLEYQDISEMKTNFIKKKVIAWRKSKKKKETAS